ncbi:MAG: Gfo/Idh/MocA family oxidoreductase [Myxococcota bacterium]
MSRRPLRGALFGHGHMGAIHARKLRERGVDVDIIDPPLGLTPSLTRQPDFAIVATPTPTHHAVAAPLLQAGVPCLVEKPLAHTLDAAAALARHNHLSVGHVERFNPALAPLRRIKPRFIEAERLAPFQRRGADVDVIADLMIHDLDLMLWMLGQPVTDLRAIGIGVMTDEIDIINARIEIGGAVATLTASRVSHKTVRTLRVVDAGAYWSADLRAKSLHRVDWGARDLTPQAVHVPDQDAIFEEQGAFLRAVRGEGPYPCTGSEALAAMALAEKVRSSCSPDRRR